MRYCLHYWGVQISGVNISAFWCKPSADARWVWPNLVLTYNTLSRSYICCHDCSVVYGLKDDISHCLCLVCALVEYFCSHVPAKWASSKHTQHVLSLERMFNWSPTQYAWYILCTYSQCYLPTYLDGISLLIVMSVLCPTNSRNSVHDGAICPGYASNTEQWLYSK